MTHHTGLENRRSGNVTEGSNPSLSADFCGFPDKDSAAHDAPFTSRSRSGDGAQVGTGESLSVDDAVRLAVAQHHAWQDRGEPSAEKQDRVIVCWGDTQKIRRPFKSRGHWRVKWAGTARIVNPHYRDGLLCFDADWSRP